MKTINQNILKYIKNKKILSLGCIGYDQNTSIQFNFLKENSHTLYGVDIEKPSKKEKNIFYGNLNSQKWFKHQFKSVDVIVCTETLEHLDDPLGTLRYIKKNKSKNTILIISVPNGTSLGRTIHGILKTNIFEYQDRYHLYVFNKKTIENLVNKSKLKIIKTLPYSTDKITGIIPFSNLSSGFIVICK